MKKFPAFKQTDIATCGPTCLLNILEYYGYHENLSEIIRRAMTDSMGNNMLSLVKTAETYGLKANAYKEGNIQDLNDELILPAIAHVIINNSLEHYVVIYKITCENVFISDPSQGLTVMTKSDFSKMWTGNIICLSKTASFKKRRFLTPALVYFFKSIIRNKTLFASIVAISAVVIGIGMITSFFYQTLVNDILPTGKAYELIRFGCFTVGLLLIKSGLNFLRQWFLVRVNLRIENTLTMETVSHILELPLAYFRSKSIGDWQTRLNEVSSICNTLCSGTLSAIIDTTMAVFGIIILWNQSQRLFMISAILAVLYLFITKRYAKILRERTEQVLNKYALRNSLVTEMLYGLPSIKANVIEDNCFKEIGQLQESLSTKRREYEKKDNARDSLLAFISSCMEIILLVVGGLEIIGGSYNLGKLLTFISLTIYFFDPIEKLSFLGTQLREASVSAQRIREIWLEDNEQPAPYQAELRIDQNITCRNMGFAYGYREEVLKEVNFDINAGEIIAIVGKNGSGKSTLALLLCGLYYPTVGLIKYGKHNTREINGKQLRSQVVYVPQDTFLFKTSIRENLINGRTDISDDRIKHFCCNLGIWEKIDNLPMGLNTVLSENGFNLSGGERQRLAIARALLAEPRILILDEITSSLDKTARDLVCELLSSMRDSVTILIITHQQEMLEICDNIILLRKGQPAIQATIDIIRKNDDYLQIFS